MGKIFKNNWGLLFVLILSWWAVGPLFHPDFFPMHDDTQVVRVNQMAKALSDGQFPVRWVADLGYGYGYPIFNFYSPLPYYAGGFFNLIGFDALLATKIMFGLGILLSGIFMYFLAREFFGETGGVVAGLFYLYAPYHAVEIYVRGVVGEFWAMAFLPLMVWGFYKVTVRPRSAGRWVAVGALGFAGVILSHNLTAMMVIPFLLIASLLHCFIASKQKKLFSIFYFLFSIFLALGLSAFYWLPALFEMGYTNVTAQVGGGANFRDHFVCLGQLWNSPWGFAGSTSGCLDGMSFKIGKLHILALFVSLAMTLFVFLARGYRYNDINHYSDKARIIFIATFGFIISLFLMFEVSKPIWEAIPPMAYIQYPWRFLIFASFFSSFLASALLWFLNHSLPRYPHFNTVPYLSGAVLIFLLLYFNVKLFQPQKYLTVSAGDYLTEENIKWKTAKISDEYLPKDFPKPENAFEVIREKLVSSPEVKVENLLIKSHRLTFSTNSLSEGKVTIWQAAFPGWQVFLDGTPGDFKISAKEIIIKVPPGVHRLEVIFENTPIRSLGNLLSLMSLLILIFGSIYVRKIRS